MISPPGDNARAPGRKVPQGAGQALPGDWRAPHSAGEPLPSGTVAPPRAPGEPLPSAGQERRDFLKIALGGGFIAWAAAVLYPVFSYLKPPKQAEVEVTNVKVGKIGQIEKDSGTIVRFGSKPVILIRTAAGEFHAFSATCTHLDCTVQYKKDLGVIWCACHNGKYDLTGRNISGPPPRPLEEYRVIVQGDEVSVSRNT